MEKVEVSRCIATSLYTCVCIRTPYVSYLFRIRSILTDSNRPGLSRDTLTEHKSQHVAAMPLYSFTMFLRHFRRQFPFSINCNNKQISGCRTFSYDSRCLQEQQHTQNGRTTHFGFKTVPETEKESKGESL